MTWISSLFAFMAGPLITVHVGSNTELKKGLGQPLPALLINYVIGFSAVLLCALIKREAVPPLGKALATPWWGWLGGISGAVYGLAAILLASQLGAATLTALVVTGQLVCSVVLDHFGCLRFEGSILRVWAGLQVVR